MRIIYAQLEGTDYPWIHEEVQKALQWVADCRSDGEFWSRLQPSLNDLWFRKVSKFMTCALPVYGLLPLVTSSAITVYPQVRIR